MRQRDTRILALLVAAAFLVLWLVSIGVAHAVPVPEPLPEPIQSQPDAGAQAVGIVGWCIVGAGFLGVALTVALESRSRRRRGPTRTPGFSHRPRRVSHTVYHSPPARRYQRNIERRY